MRAIPSLAAPANPRFLREGDDPRLGRLPRQTFALFGDGRVVHDENGAVDSRLGLQGAQGREQRISTVAVDHDAIHVRELKGVVQALIRTMAVASS